MWYFLDSKISFEMSLIVIEAICGRSASFTAPTATVSEIFGGQTNSSILVSLVYIAGSKQTLDLNQLLCQSILSCHNVFSLSSE